MIIFIYFFFILLYIDNKYRCIDTYFDNGVSNCVQCDYKCGNCESTVTNCTTCNAGSNRVAWSLTNYDCICEVGFFDNGAIQCIACSYQCGTCLTSSTNCLTCIGNSRVDWSTNNLCVCETGFFDDA